jgi:hypothetical protein
MGRSPSARRRASLGSGNPNQPAAFHLGQYKRSQMLWNFATVFIFVVVLGSTLIVLMTDREVFLTDREKVQTE